MPPTAEKLSDLFASHSLSVSQLQPGTFFREVSIQPGDLMPESGPCMRSAEEVKVGYLFVVTRANRTCKE